MGMKERNCVSLSGYADVLNEDEGQNDKVDAFCLGIYNYNNK